MDKLLSFALIIFCAVTPVTIGMFYLLFRKSLTFKIGLIVTLLLDTISILSFVNGAGGELKTMMWMGPLGVSIIILGFFIIIRSLKNFDKLTKQIELIADKDINTDIEEHYLLRKDEIGNIARAISKMRQNQVKMFSDIEKSSIEIENLSKNLTTVAQKISESACEQASATEETLSSMEEILESINSNTKQANEASIVSSKSASEIENSNEAFIKTIQSVSDISEKIEIISDIAYQTNILSLNASVEASRAGEHGKGFGVVAQEIRKLADTTNTASSDINRLSKEGIQISEEARDKLQKIVPEIIESAKMVKSITESSIEQQQGAELIKTSIQQLTETTNQNSASSEEMLASAEDLSEQAKQLNELISNL